MVCRQRDTSFHSCGNQSDYVVVNKGEQVVRKTPVYISYGSSTSSSSMLTKSMPEDLSRKQGSRSGICGLQNLGNTCFMNSGLQCLSNTEDLTRIFLEDRYQSDFNPSNRIGTGCKLVKAFAALMKEMWFGTESSVSPSYFKRELGDFVPQFYGFQQQDSHELICYTLDLIHEDLNRVKEKPTPQEVNTEGLSESQIAARFWGNHLSRNQSWIVDLMHGQYRSQVTCPDCRNVSLTFDPFVAVSVSLPPKTTEKAFEPVFVPYDVSTPLLKLRVKVGNRALAGDIKSAVAAILGKDKESLLVTKSFNYSVIETLGDRVDLSDFPQHYPLVVLEVPSVPQKIPVFLDVLKKPESRYSSKTSFANTRAILIDENSTMREVHLAVYSYLMAVRRVASQSPEPTAAELSEMYDQDFRRDSPDQYPLNVVNLQREKLQYVSSTTHYSTGGYSRLRCDFCKRPDCFNCPLPGDSSGTFKEFAQLNQSGKMLKLEVILPSSHIAAMRPLLETQVHESVLQGAREEQEVKSQALTIQECLTHSSLPEKLDADNEVYCGKCRKHVQADKQMGIYRLPKVLILHLKRFKEKGYRREKDDRLIRFPVEGLDMQPFVLGPIVDSPVYDLYAVSNHFGGMGGGHYTAYAKNCEKKEWYGFNDSSASRVSGNVEETVVTTSAYVLFYRRREATVTDPVVSSPA